MSLAQVLRERPQSRCGGTKKGERGCHLAAPSGGYRTARSALRRRPGAGSLGQGKRDPGHLCLRSASLCSRRPGGSRFRSSKQPSSGKRVWQLGLSLLSEPATILGSLGKLSRGVSPPHPEDSCAPLHTHAYQTRGKTPPARCFEVVLVPGQVSRFVEPWPIRNTEIPSTDQALTQHYSPTRWHARPACGDGKERKQIEVEQSDVKLKTS